MKNIMRIDKARLWLQTELSLEHAQHAPILALHLLSWVCQKTSAELIAHQDDLITQEQLHLLTQALDDHIKNHKPIQYIIGKVPFLSATITVRPPTLIPRPETELWCDYMINELKKSDQEDLQLLDLCTGSGCVAIALAQAFKKATIYAVDICPKALALVQENALNNGCTNIVCVQSDLFTQLPDLTFDAIVSNPPYVSEQQWHTLEPVVKKWEDPRALIARDDGLYLIKKIINQAPDYLRQGTSKVPQLLIEYSDHHADKVAQHMKKRGYSIISHHDSTDKPRFITGTLDEQTA